MKTHILGLFLTLLLSSLGGPLGTVVGIALWVWMVKK